MEIQVYIFRIVCALLFGFCIGLERQIRKRNAGLVTNTLVAIGACSFILISESIITASIQAGGPVNNDNLRVLSQVVTGIGFLGAGVILKDGVSIHGLNSAATLWCSAAVGCLCGYGLWKEALVSSMAILITNWLFKWLEHRMEKKSPNERKE